MKITGKSRLQARFEARISKCGPVVRPELGPCWEWRGGTTPQGYGRVRITNQKTGDRFLVLPHRISYLLYVGDIPQSVSYHGICVCHCCDNPRCVRPEHLFLGSHRANVQDAVRKRRQHIPKPRRHLSWETAQKLRTLYAQGGTSHRKLAAKFGIHHSQVRNILAGATYKTP